MVTTSECIKNKKIEWWEPWFFIIFGLFHIHRIWGLIDRTNYANFWMGLLETRGVIYFIIMGILALLCILGIITFIKNRRSNYWWRWIYIFGGVYVLFDLVAIELGFDFWYKLLNFMFDVQSPYWNIIWSFFIILGIFSFILGISILKEK